MDLKEINLNLDDLYRINTKRIYLEIISYALVGWVLFFLSIYFSNLFLLTIASLVIYRGLSFIHEMSHLSKKIPLAYKLYNYLLGFPNRVPCISMMTHRYHHNPITFSTIKDPEYERWTSKPKYVLARPLVMSLLTPIVLTLRFGIFPLSYLFFSKKSKQNIYEKASSFVMNMRFLRPFNQADYQQVIKEDIYCCLYFFSICLVTLYLNVFAQAFIYWCIMMAFISLLNTYRALIAHRYAAHLNQDDSHVIKQLKDSVTVEGSWLTELWAPIGLRYHSTHHLFPNIPYHSLAKAHYRLKKILPANHPYHSTVETNFFNAFFKLYKSFDQKSVL